jgi:hypothetical protein
LLSASFSKPPIDLSDQVLVWHYQVRENLQASGGGDPTQPYLLFATGHLLPRGAARLDVSRAGFANTAIF